MGIFKKKKTDEISCKFMTFGEFIPNMPDNWAVIATIADDVLHIKSNPLCHWHREVSLPYEKITSIQEGKATITYNEDKGDFIAGLAGAAIAGLPGAYLANKLGSTVVQKEEEIPLLVITYMSSDGEEACILLKINGATKGLREFIDAVCEKTGLEDTTSPENKVRPQEPHKIFAPTSITL